MSRKIKGKYKNSFWTRKMSTKKTELNVDTNLKSPHVQCKVYITILLNNYRQLYPLLLCNIGKY